MIQLWDVGVVIVCTWAATVSGMTAAATTIAAEAVSDLATYIIEKGTAA